MVRRKSEKKKSERKSSRRIGFSRARRIGSKTGVKWGEALLAALVGYFTPKVMEATPIPALVVQRGMVNQPNSSVLNQAYASMPSYANDPVGWVSDETAKFGAFLALAKSGYDVVKHHKLTSEDKTVLIPFAIGALLAPKSGNSAGVA